VGVVGNCGKLVDEVMHLVTVHIQGNIGLMSHSKPWGGGMNVAFWKG